MVLGTRVHQNVEVDGFEQRVIVNAFGERVETFGDEGLSVGEIELDADGNLFDQCRDGLTQFVVTPES